MPKQTLSNDQKYQAVMDILQGGSLSEICNRYGISQTYLYKLRDRAFAAVAESVKNKQDRPRTREERLDSELSKAKQMIGDQSRVSFLPAERSGLADHKRSTDTDHNRLLPARHS